MFLVKRYNAFFHIISNERNKSRGVRKAFKYYSREFSLSFFWLPSQSIFDRYWTRNRTPGNHQPAAFPPISSVIHSHFSLTAISSVHPSFATFSWNHLYPCCHSGFLWKILLSCYLSLHNDLVGHLNASTADFLCPLNICGTNQITILALYYC